MPAIDIDGGVPATTLASGITSGSTSIIATDGSGYPDGGNGNFYITLNRGLSGEETVEISSRSGNTFTVANGISGRGADGTSATSHSTGATVEHTVPASALQEMNDHANATTGTPHGTAYVTPSGNVATATALATARDIGGVSFDGTANINLPGVNEAGTQDTSGNAATATDLAAWSSALGLTLTDFTPTCTQGVSVTVTNNNSKYVQIGKLVVCLIRFAAGSSGTIASAIEIGGLPVASANLSAFWGSGLAEVSQGYPFIVRGGFSTTSIRGFETHAQPATVFGASFGLTSSDSITALVVYEAA